MQQRVGSSVIEVVQGDITQQPDMQAVVNAANAQLQPGGGVAGAIHRQAGNELARACRPLAPIQAGQAVITDAFELPNDFVIHCLGPIHGLDRPSDQLLADCYKNALQLAEQNHISSIAFPAISAGAFGYPLRQAAQIAINTTKQVLSNKQGQYHVRFVLFSTKDEQAFQEVLQDSGH